VSCGFNGAPTGIPHCDDVGHQLVEIDGKMSCIKSLHAESNALDDAGRAACGGTIYVTVTPCFECSKRIIQAGIKRVVYDEYYSSRNTDLVEDLFKQAGIKLEQIPL
jgi:dCMP deaminase